MRPARQVHRSVDGLVAREHALAHPPVPRERERERVLDLAPRDVGLLALRPDPGAVHVVPGLVRPAHEDPEALGRPERRRGHRHLPRGAPDLEGERRRRLPGGVRGLAVDHGGGLAAERPRGEIRRPPWPAAARRSPSAPGAASPRRRRGRPAAAAAFAAAAAAARPASACRAAASSAAFAAAALRRPRPSPRPPAWPPRRPAPPRRPSPRRRRAPRPRGAPASRGPPRSPGADRASGRSSSSARRSGSRPRAAAARRPSPPAGPRSSR